MITPGVCLDPENNTGKRRHSPALRQHRPLRGTPISQIMPRPPNRDQRRHSSVFPPNGGTPAPCSVQAISATVVNPISRPPAAPSLLRVDVLSGLPRNPSPYLENLPQNRFPALSSYLNVLVLALRVLSHSRLCPRVSMPAAPFPLLGEPIHEFGNALDVLLKLSILVKSRETTFLIVTTDTDSLRGMIWESPHALFRFLLCAKCLARFESVCEHASAIPSFWSNSSAARCNSAKSEEKPEAVKSSAARELSEHSYQAHQVPRLGHQLRGV